MKEIISRRELLKRASFAGLELTGLGFVIKAFLDQIGPSFGTQETSVASSLPSSR